MTSWEVDVNPSLTIGDLQFQTSFDLSNRNLTSLLSSNESDNFVKKGDFHLHLSNDMLSMLLNAPSCTCIPLLDKRERKRMSFHDEWFQITQRVKRRLKDSNHGFVQKFAQNFTGETQQFSLEAQDLSIDLGSVNASYIAHKVSVYYRCFCNMKGDRGRFKSSEKRSFSSTFCMSHSLYILGLPSHFIFSTICCAKPAIFRKSFLSLHLEPVF